MKCVDDTLLMRVHAGQLSAEEVDALQQHCSSCPRCSALRDEWSAITGRLAPDVDEFHDPDFSNEVMTLIRTGRAEREFSRGSRPSWRAWRGWPLVPLTVAAAAAALLVVAWPRSERVAVRPKSGLQARGGGQLSPDRWVSLRIYQRRGQVYQQVGREVAGDDALAFSYLNRAPSSYRFLMIFAVDHRGQVYWYYPAHTDANKNPASIKIGAGSAYIALPDQVRHQWTKGALRIIGLFSRTPIDVQTVEKTVARQMAEVKIVEQLTRVQIAGTGQHVRLLQVSTSASDDGKAK